MQYCGNQLDASTLDRFAMVEVGYDAKIDLAMAGGDADLVEFIHEMRKVAETMNFIISYRSIQRIASMKGVLDMRKVLKQGLFKGLSVDDWEIIRTNLTRTLRDNPYTRAMNGEAVEFTSTAKKAGKKSA